MTFHTHIKGPRMNPEEWGDQFHSWVLSKMNLKCCIGFKLTDKEEDKDKKVEGRQKQEGESVEHE